MPPKARVVAIGMPHRLTPRGNGRRDVFFHLYLNTLFEHAERWHSALSTRRTQEIGEEIAVGATVIRQAD
jgi:hypothetical protein